MDAWEIIFHDPRFLMEAELKVEGRTSDASILSQFLARAEAQESLERVQEAAFSGRANTWRTNPNAEIPKPPFSMLCGLLGYRRDGAAANPHFQATRTTLDQLHSRLPAPRFQACRIFLVGVTWDFHAMAVEIANRARPASSAMERDRLREEMAELREASSAAFLDAVRACRENRIGLPPPERQAEFDCER